MTPIGIAEIHNDISELRRAEEAVRQADRRKDEFLAMLAHELRNPLAPIRMGLELMKLCQDDPGNAGRHPAYDGTPDPAAC